MLRTAALLLAGVIALAPAAAKGPTTILSVIIDDMGWYDSQPHNPTAPTPTLGAWAKEGILLERQCAWPIFSYSTLPRSVSGSVCRCSALLR